MSRGGCHPDVRGDVIANLPKATFRVGHENGYEQLGYSRASEDALHPEFPG